MSLVAEILLEHPDLALSDALRADPQLTVRAEHRAATLGAQARSYVVDRERAAAFEGAVDGDHTVADWRLAEAYADRHLYRIAFSDELKVITPGIPDRGIRILGSTSEGRGRLVRMIAPDREALESLREYCERGGVSSRLRKIRDAVDHREGDRGVDLDLTERQRERDGRDETKLRPLGVVLDADALDAVLASPRADGGTSAFVPDGSGESGRDVDRISFSYSGYRVTVLPEGVVRLVAGSAD